MLCLITVIEYNVCADWEWQHWHRLTEKQLHCNPMLNTILAISFLLRIIGFHFTCSTFSSHFVPIFLVTWPLSHIEWRMHLMVGIYIENMLQLEKLHLSYWLKYWQSKYVLKVHIYLAKANVSSYSNSLSLDITEVM